MKNSFVGTSEIRIQYIWGRFQDYTCKKTPGDSHGGRDIVLKSVLKFVLKFEFVFDEEKNHIQITSFQFLNFPPFNIVLIPTIVWFNFSFNHFP